MPSNSVTQAANSSQNSGSSAVSNPPPTRKNYKPYRDADYPTFSGDYEDYCDWKKEWQEWIIPDQDFNWVLRNMQRCTPVADDLRICETMEDVWHLMDRKYANSLVVSNEVLDGFLALRPHRIPGRNEECKLLNLSQAIQRLKKQLTGVQEEHQLTENIVSVRQILKLIPDIYEDGTPHQKPLRWSRSGPSKARRTWLRSCMPSSWNTSRESSTRTLPGS